MLPTSFHPGGLLWSPKSTHHKQLLDTVMSISKQDLAHLGKLAGLALEGEELEQLRHDVNQVLSHVESLEKVATRGVVETSHVHGITNVMREDVIRESLSTNELDKNAPDFDSHGFKVPRVI